MAVRPQQRIDTKQVAQGLAGLPSQESMLQPKNFDKVPAVVRNQDGSKEQPAALTEGEYIFSVPAIIALGEGDHQKGLQVLEEVHNMLREKSKGFMDDKGIASAGLGVA